MSDESTFHTHDGEPPLPPVLDGAVVVTIESLKSQVASLKAERDDMKQRVTDTIKSCVAAEAEVERLREALERLEIQARWVKSIAEADYGMKCTELGLAIDSAAALSPTNPSGPE